jgi:uncharacterized protein (DUF427 family)
MIQATCNGQVIAESDDTVVVDGNHYFPREAVREEFLAPSDTTTTCPWKGVANYHHVVVDDVVHRDVAWYYAETKPDAAAITGRIAFWRDVKVG